MMNFFTAWGNNRIAASYCLISAGVLHIRAGRSSCWSNSGEFGETSLQPDRGRFN
jgi:hypothetical protein